MAHTGYPRSVLFLCTALTLSPEIDSRKRDKLETNDEGLTLCGRPTTQTRHHATRTPAPFSRGPRSREHAERTRPQGLKRKKTKASICSRCLSNVYRTAIGNPTAKGAGAPTRPREGPRTRGRPPPPEGQATRHPRDGGGSQPPSNAGRRTPTPNPAGPGGKAHKRGGTTRKGLGAHPKTGGRAPPPRDPERTEGLGRCLDRKRGTDDAQASVKRATQSPIKQSTEPKKGRGAALHAHHVGRKTRYLADDVRHTSMQKTSRTA